MKINTKQGLISFEEEVGELFNQGLIKAPVHLYDGNEDEMIDIFKDVKTDDWVFCTWRSHYQCLLKGVDSEILKKDIISGKSIALCYPEYKIYSSAIVTGILPIATGAALDIKLKNGTEKVWCFVGDMTAETGAFYENYKYAINMDLPIIFVIEDNSKSVCTETLKTWNHSAHSYSKPNMDKIIYYKYNTKYPHAGAGKRIQF